MKQIFTLSLCMALCACGGTRVVDLNNSANVQDMSNVMELEYRDWTNTAESMTDSMVASGAFAKISDPVIAIGTIKNDTMQRFDTDILTKKIRSTLINSGRAQITTAFQNQETTATGLVPVTTTAGVVKTGRGGATVAAAQTTDYIPVTYATNVAEDETTYQARNLRGNSEYDASTIVESGTLVAPNMSLTGKMIQRNLNIESGWFSSVDTRVEYYLQLTLTNLKTGLSVWEDEQPIVKEGSYAPTW